MWAVGITKVLLAALTMTSVTETAISRDEPISTDGFRCATNRIVELGDSRAQVLDKCGPPTSAVVRRGRRGKDELWTYDLGPTEFVRILQFDTADKLTKVMLGEYGSPSPK